MEKRYLELLGKIFPTIEAAATEIINLEAILSLPKGTEHFVSDLHGASNAFIHMIKNASGVIRRKIDDIYGDTISEQEKRALCALIYYPDERIRMVQSMEFILRNLNSCCTRQLIRLTLYKIIKSILCI